MAGKAHRDVLGDYFSLQRGMTYKSRLLDQPGPVLLGLASIQRNGGFRIDSLRTYGGESPTKLLVQPGELFLSLKDVTQSADLLGAVARLPLDHAPGRLTQDTVKLESKGASVPLNYLYWLLRTPQYRSYCRAHATGTTNLGLAREDFLAFPAPEPTPTQQKIAETLDALDDKIELNHRMNETLEAMARALFKSWFVDFDPVRAKIERHPPYLASDLWSLFPNALTGSGYPDGWQSGILLDLCELKRGYDLPAPKRSYGPIPIISSSGVSGYHVVPMAQAPGVVTGRYGTIGQVYFINRAYWPLNTALYVRDFKSNSPRFVYYVLRQVEFLQYSDKAAVPGINRNHLHQAPVILPPPTIQDAFERLLAPLWARQETNDSEIATLAALRDTLLPKLIFGELSVKRTERHLESVL